MSRSYMMNTTGKFLLFLCGDVVLARGIDQILPFPGKPNLPTEWVRHASRYVSLAESVNGPISRPVSFDYIWGDTLKEFDRMLPDVKIINLECAITQSDDYWKNKPVLYRVNPENINVLTAASVHCCILANNHILDWGYQGLEDTINTLNNVGIAHVGAGKTIEEAESPVMIQVPNREGRLIILALGSPDSGVYPQWAAKENKAGVFYIDPLKLDESVEKITRRMNKEKRKNDTVIVSIHWGSNWGFDVPEEHIELAHALIDNGVDLIYGHSSHHVRPIEVYKNRLILYGCGDFIDDYEGIGGHEEYRSELGLMYFPMLETGTGKLVDLVMTPTKVAKMRVGYANRQDATWLANVLNKVCKSFGTAVTLSEQEGVQQIRLTW